MEPLKTKVELMRIILRLHDKYTLMKVKLTNYKIRMFLVYGLALVLFGLMMIIMIIKTFS